MKRGYEARFMTTGSTINDYRVLTPTGSGSFLIGTYLSKVWSGGDKVVKKPSRETVHYPLPTDPVTGKVEWRKYRAPALKPKRHYNEEHWYEMVSIQRHDGVSSYVFNNLPSGPPDPPVTCSYYFSGGGLNSNSFWDSNDDLALIGKLRTKVAGSDFNLAVFLGEGNKALSMIAENATRIYRAYRSARRGNMTQAALDLVGSVSRKGNRYVKPANNWLELQYGWLPLLKDVRGGAEFLAHHLETPIQLKVVARHRKVGTVTSLSGNDSLKGYNVNTGQIIYLRKEVDVPSLSGLMDPASLAWELLPYSFVLDWFLPVSSWLQARGLSQSMTGTFVTTKKTMTFGTNPYRINGTLTWDTDFKEKVVRLTRSVSSVLQVPFPRVKPLSEAASWMRATNALALLSQLKLR